MAQKKSASKTTAAAPIEVPTESAGLPMAMRALEGDNYLTIAERYNLDAGELFALNGGAPVRAGARIVLQ